MDERPSLLRYGRKLLTYAGGIAGEIWDHTGGAALEALRGKQTPACPATPAQTPARAQPDQPDVEVPCVPKAAPLRIVFRE